MWNREKNWEPLWEAIQDVADRRVLDKSPRPRFLGAIVLAQLRTETGEVEARQVIDGQQRLTTLQIALAAMRDVAGGLDSEDYKEAFRQMTRNHIPSKKSADNAFKVWPTNRDRSDFKKTMTAHSAEARRELYDVPAKARSCGHLIPDAYLFFCRQLSDWLSVGTSESTEGESGGSEEADELERRLECLWTAMRQDLILVVIDLAEKDDPQLIFETLNALGTPLLPADLVKNYLFHQAIADKLNIQELYDHCWKPFDDQSHYWRKEVRQGRLNRPQIDLFLQHYLTLKMTEEAVATNLFGNFKDYVGKSADDLSAADHLHSLREYGDIYHSFESFPLDTVEGRFFYRLREMDTTTVLPVLLELFRSQKSLEECRQVVADLESYLIRRAICGWTPKNFNRMFTDLIKRLTANGYTANEVRTFLLERTGESGKWPTDRELEYVFLERPLYHQITRARLRLVLEAIELAIHDEKSEKISIAEQLTIEHIMPQEWHRHWPLDEGAGLEEENDRELLIHTIGNLSLVTKKLNPSLSNSPWAKKKEAILEHSALALNRKLKIHENWDESCIRKRSRELFELAKKVWRRPAGEKDDIPIIPQNQSSLTTAERRELRREYWTLFLERLAATPYLPKFPKAPRTGWLRFGINRPGFRLLCFVNHAKEYIGVALVCGGPHVASSIGKLKAEQEAIEAEVGEQLLWDVATGDKTHHIALRWNDVDPFDKEHWPAQHEWLVEKLQSFYQAFDDRCKDLVAERGDGDSINEPRFQFWKTFREKVIAEAPNLEPADVTNGASYVFDTVHPAFRVEARVNQNEEDLRVIFVGNEAEAHSEIEVLRDNKDDIGMDLGVPATWGSGKLGHNLRVRLRKKYETEDGEDWERIWPEQHEWLLNTVTKFKKIFESHLVDLETTAN